MQSNLTRRQALTAGAGAAAIVAGAASATAFDHNHDRAEWLALWQAFLDQCPIDTAATNVAEKAQFAARREHPEPPKILQRRVNDELVLDAFGKPLASTRDELEWHHAAVMKTWGDHPEHGAKAIEGHKRRLAALKAHKAACRKVDRRFNVPALKAAAKAADDAEDAASDAIAERPAHSMVGFAVKLAKWVRHDGSSPMIGATLDDASSENRPVIMAYRDAVRLAGLPENMYAERLS